METKSESENSERPKAVEESGDATETGNNPEHGRRDGGDANDAGRSFEYVPTPYEEKKARHEKTCEFCGSEKEKGACPTCVNVQA